MRSPEARRADVDTRAVRLEVRSIIHSLDHMRPSEAYWHVGTVVDEVRQVLDGAWERIEARDERAALHILDAITDEYSEAWEYLDDSNGEVGEFFHELGAAWAEAILGA